MELKAWAIQVAAGMAGDIYRVACIADKSAPKGVNRAGFGLTLYR